MTIKATGRRAEVDALDSVVFERTFRGPIESVWAAVTESDRLERWIGTWTGEPTSGKVVFRMNAEGDTHSSENVTIHDCDPPRRLAVTTNTEGEPNS